MPRKRKDYRVELAPDGTLTTEHGHPLEVPRGWTPEHLLLAALARCTLLALDHYAREASLAARGSASAHGSVDLRADGLWALVDIQCALDVTVEPRPPEEQTRELVATTERGCFVGSSLAEKPRYSWRVNGEDI